MKKMLVLFIVSVFSASVMSACNSGAQSNSEKISSEIKISEDTQKSSTDVQNDTTMLKKGYSAYEYFCSMVNANDYNEGSDVLEYNGKEYPLSMNLKDDKSVVYDFNPLVNMGDETSISLPCSFDKLEEAGWKCSEESKNKVVKGVTNSENFSPSAQGLLINFKNDSGKRISAGLYNYNEEEKKVSECVCTYIAINVRSNSESSISNDCPDFAIDDVINQNLNSLDDLTDELGEPSNYSFSKDTGEITVTYRQKSNEQKYVSLTFYYDESDNSTLLSLVKINSSDE